MNTDERGFRISAAGLARRLGETPAEVRDRFSVAYLVATAARVIRELAGLARRARHAGKRVATLTLEAEIRFASAEARTAFAEELANTVVHLTVKYHDEHAEGGRRFRLLAACYPAGSPAKHDPSEQSQKRNRSNAGSRPRRKWSRARTET